MYLRARARERINSYLGDVRCIQDENVKLLVEEVKIKERWQRYFSKLFKQ